MDLKIKDVADLLSVSETTVRRWLLDGKIPAYKLNRQYRFSKIEIENWMMEQKMHPEAAAFQHFSSGEEQIYPLKKENSQTPGIQQFSLYRAINRGGAHLHVPGKDKETVICNAMEKIAPILRLDPEVLSELLLDREKLMPTAFNHGVAVPHARECLQRTPFDLVAVVFPETPVEYGALDENPVDILFFLFATGDKIHLHLLSKLAHLSSNKEALEFFRTHPEKSKLLEYVRQWEGTVRLTH